MGEGVDVIHVYLMQRLTCNILQFFTHITLHSISKKGENNS